MLTIQVMQDRLAQMTYRPGWEMRIYEGYSMGARFELKAMVEDSVNKGRKVPLHILSPVPTNARLSIQSFDVWLHWRLKEVEVHESMEWLQVGGKPLFDPHKKDADQDML
jgi:hypothetical protein